MATLTTTPIKVFVSGETVTPSKLNELSQSTVALTAGTIVNADVSASAAIALSKLATGALPTAITVSSANLVDGTIVNADISASAAIGLSKLATGALPTAITVSSANMVTATAQALLPAGAVMPFAMNSAPSGWLAADGAAVSRSTYATLFAAIGTTHGVGDGSTTFNLPDLRGIFVRGSDSQTISGTAYSGTFATKQQDAFQGHAHYGTFIGSVSGAGTVVASGSNLNRTLVSETDGTIAGSNGTPRVAAETRPANIALLYCIKF